MKLKRIGFFRELNHGDKAGQSLVGSLGKPPRADESEICKYLRDAVLLIGCPGAVADVLDSSSEFIGSPSIFTDGVWAWPGDLEYYLKNYHVSLQSDFLDHIQRMSYKPPTDDEINLSGLEF